MTKINALSVDPAKGLTEMIVACACGWNHPDITVENFPVVGTGAGVVKMEYKIFHFGRTIVSGVPEELIVADDLARPWVPAKIDKLLTYGAANPDEQRKYPIVALGSVASIDQDDRVPCLTMGLRERSLDLEWLGVNWPGHYRFLAVRPVLEPLAV